MNRRATVGPVWAVTLDSKTLPGGFRELAPGEGKVTVEVFAEWGGDREFLLRLLRVAADDDDLDPAEFEFAVITAGRGDIGAVSYWPWDKGEILAVPVDGYGSRDLKEGRSFNKYDIREERFGRDWEAAKRRSAEVKAGPDVDMFAWTEAP